MIELKNLKKNFGSLCVLDDISLTIETGRIFGLAGRSGAGKSTLLRCINGLESYDEGCLKVDGVELNTLNSNQMRHFRKSTGMIFQQFALMNQLNVFQNVALPLNCWQYKRSYISERVKQLLEMVGIPEKVKAYPGQLSGGQKQRVAIARALAMEPRILLCDEATSALDPNTSASILTLLKKINEEMGITIIVVAHQMSVIRSICQRMAVIENGRIMACGEVDDIFIKEPAALMNLMGSENNIGEDEGSLKIKVVLADELTKIPVFSRLSRELDVDIIMVSGETGFINNRKLSSFIIQIPADCEEKVGNYLNERKIFFKRINRASGELNQVDGDENV